MNTWNELQKNNAKNDLTFPEVLNLAKFYNISLQSLTEENYKEKLNETINAKHKDLVKKFNIGDEVLVTRKDSNRTALSKIIKLDMGYLYLESKSSGRAFKCKFFLFKENEKKQQKISFFEFFSTDLPNFYDEISLDQIEEIPKGIEKELQEKYPSGTALGLWNMTQSRVVSLKKNIFFKDIILRKITLENSIYYYYFLEPISKKIIKHKLSDFTLEIYAQRLVKDDIRHRQEDSPYCYYATFRPVVTIYNHFKKTHETYVYDDNKQFTLLEEVVLDKQELKYIKENYLPAGSSTYFDFNNYDFKFGFKRYVSEDFTLIRLDDGDVHIGDKWYFVNISTLNTGSEILSAKLFTNVNIRQYKYFKFKKEMNEFIKEEKANRKLAKVK